MLAIKIIFKKSPSPCWKTQILDLLLAVTYYFFSCGTIFYFTLLNRFLRFKQDIITGHISLLLFRIFSFSSGDTYNDFMNNKHSCKCTVNIPMWPISIRRNCVHFLIHFLKMYIASLNHTLRNRKNGVNLILNEIKYIY